MAEDWAKGKAALRGPDQIAGGNANDFPVLGDGKINSTMGSQWKSRISKLDDHINGQAVSYPGTAKLSELGIKFVLP